MSLRGRRLEAEILEKHISAAKAQINRTSAARKIALIIFYLASCFLPVSG